MRKISSKPLEEANKRLASIKSIDPALDLGNGLTVLAYQAKIDSVEALLESYNTDLSNLDAKRASLKATVKALTHLSELMLLGVATKFGKDATEYQKAGGVRKSDRKRSKKLVKV